MPTLLPKGFIPFHNIDGAKAVVLPGEDGKRVSVVWAHAGPLADKIAKTAVNGKSGAVELGPRHVVSLKAWKGTKVEAPKPEKAAAKKAPTVKKAAPVKAAAKKAPAKAEVDGDENRPRGRPRKDGLMPGSEAVGILKHAHETRTVVPQAVLEQMTPETRLIEEARNDRLTSGSPRRGRPPKGSNVVPISQAKKAPKKAAAADKPASGRRLLRRATAASAE